MHPVLQPRLQRQLSAGLMGRRNSVSRVKSPVMISWLLTTAPVRPVRVSPSVLAPAETTRSPPISASASPVATRIALISSGLFGQTAMDVHRAALLRQPGHFHHARALAIDLRRLRHHRADGDHAGATDAGDHHVKGAVDLRQLGLRQIRQVQIGRRLLANLSRLPASQRTGRSL